MRCRRSFKRSYVRGPRRMAGADEHGVRVGAYPRRGCLKFAPAVEVRVSKDAALQAAYSPRQFPLLAARVNSMGYITEFERIAALLPDWFGGTALFWGYGCSLRRAVFRLGAKGRAGPLWIAAVSSEYIAGPFSWSDARVEARNHSEPSEDPTLYVPRFQLFDQEAGFSLHCGGLIAWTGTDPDMMPDLRYGLPSKGQQRRHVQGGSDEGQEGQ